MTTIVMALTLLLTPSITTAKAPWPGTSWTTAKAFTFNWTSYGPTAKHLHVYQEPRGIHPNVRNSHPLTPKQAAEALQLVKRTEGEALVSGCPFPRHGVIFYDAKNTPVGSVSVCFGCGDVLVWPSYGKPTRKKKKRSGEYTTRFMKRYDAAMIGWRKLFADLPDMPKWKPSP